MSQCKKFAPNIFNKTRCTNCFRQKEEHSTEALECNRASRKVARSGYLFVAPDWDFAVPLNRSKRWQRRWFVLYDDGELNYSVDEHPDTVPQGQVDMCRVVEVTGAEQVTGHPHSLALTSPDRVTFIKAASREDARSWAELLAVFPRRHKRHATFPGGRASPSLPQLGRSSSPQPARPRHLSCASVRTTTFLTPLLKEERGGKDRFAKRERKQKNDAAIPSIPVSMDTERKHVLTDSEKIDNGSPSKPDKNELEQKCIASQDWQCEKFPDTAFTSVNQQSSESILPPSTVENLKKGWLWLHSDNGNSKKYWWILCEATFSAYKDQDEMRPPELEIELNTITGFKELITESRYGFQIECNGGILIISAASSGIRSNWLQALQKAINSVFPSSVILNVSEGESNPLEVPSALDTVMPTIHRSTLLSSDEEYRTASEGGRRGSEDWGEGPPSPPLTRTTLSCVKEKTRLRPHLPRAQSRHSTVDSTSTDELDSAKEVINMELRNSLNKQGIEMEDLRKQLYIATEEIHNLGSQLESLRKAHSGCITREKQTQELLSMFEKAELELHQKIKQVEENYSKEQHLLQERLSAAEIAAQHAEEKCHSLSHELKNKQPLVKNMEQELSNLNKQLQDHQKDVYLAEKLQQFEIEKAYGISRTNSLTDLTDTNLNISIENCSQNELIGKYIDLRSRFEKAVVEIKALKQKLHETNMIYDDIEFQNINLRKSLENAQKEAESHAVFMAMRVQDLTTKLLAAEKQARTIKSKLQDSKEKRRSLSLRGKESLTLNKEVEEKLDELEAKVLNLEKTHIKRKHKREVSSERASPVDDRSLRRLRRKSLDSSIATESMRMIMQLNNLETKIDNVASSDCVNNTVISSPPELNFSTQDDSKPFETKISIAKSKLHDCLNHVLILKGTGIKFASSPSKDRLSVLEADLKQLINIFEASAGTSDSTEENVVASSANNVVQQLEKTLRTKLFELSNKKQELIKKGELNDHTRLELLAEKIIFENILITRIQEALEAKPSSDISCDRLLKKEVVETFYLLSALKSKLNGSKEAKVPLCRTGTQYLSKILVKQLLNSSEDFKSFVSTHGRFKPIVNNLRKEQKQIDIELKHYKNIKLPQLADALAAQAINLTFDTSCKLPVLDDNILEEIWATAKEISSKELIETEIDHTLMRSAQIYESVFSSDNTFFFSFYASERAALELWNDASEQYLYSEMQKNIEELTEHYRDSFSKFQCKKIRKQDLEQFSSNANTLLTEFADIMAHKALIDARISVLAGEFKQSSISDCRTDYSATNLLKIERLIDSLENFNLVQINQSLEAEFKCMLSSASERCSEIVSHYDLEAVNDALLELASEIFSLKKCIGNVHEDEDVKVFCTTWKEICRKCQVLQKQLVNIRKFIKGNKVMEFIEECPSHVSREYITQTESIRSSFREALATCENDQQQAELQNLQGLCERALYILEQWHRQTVHEIHETYNQEMKMLRQDKEQALAEETQATLAALDAMRKAHEAEVQREVSKFKQDFAREQQRELLDLTERLSVKCLETAALEEQLGCATKQLAQAHKHILQLKRNPQLSRLQN